MKRLVPLILAVAVAMVLGCQQQPVGPTPDEIAARKMEQAMQAGTGGNPIASTDTVEVAAGGTRFEPPVEVAQLPAGVWYCDMGTVHYARATEGDSRCAVCGMTLSQNP